MALISLRIRSHVKLSSNVIYIYNIEYKLSRNSRVGDYKSDYTNAGIYSLLQYNIVYAWNQ